MNDSNKNLGTPHISAPEVAYRRPDVYRQGVNLVPRDDKMPYMEYAFMGRMPLGELDTFAARDEARKLYGPRTDVFRTARYWVCFTVA